MRILLTGASGFLGSRVLAELLAREHEVHAVVRASTDRWRMPPEGATGLVLHEARLDEPPIEPELAIHLAWYSVPGRYLSATDNFECLEMSERLAGRLRCRMVAAGTCFEYLESSDAMRESHPLAPGTLYASCKDSLRRRLEERGDQAWLRFFPMYGPGEDPRRLVPSVAIPILERREARLTAGAQRRDYLHVDDAARAVVDVSLSNIEGPVNICSGRAPTVAEVAIEVSRRAGASELLRLGAVPGRTGDPHVILGDPSLLRSIGWTPRYDLVSGVDDTVSWWEQAPLGRRKAWRH